MFWFVRGSQGCSYFVTSDGCSCPGYRHRGVCSHQVAATMKEAQEAALAIVGALAPAWVR